MPPALFLNPEFAPLSEKDYTSLGERWITREIAERAYLRRVSSLFGGELVGRMGRAGDYEGVAIPYLWPGDEHVVLYRLRRDHPDIEQGHDGKLKPRRKYLTAPGAPNRLYLAPQTELAQLADVNLPLVITEGEFKTLALWRLSWEGLGDAAETPSFVPVGLSGVWNWRGSVGKTEDADGRRSDVRGAIPDLDRIEWAGRHVMILFDADLERDFSNIKARIDLTADLEQREAIVSWFVWPPGTPSSQKGIDDYLHANGADRVKRLFARAKVKTRKRRAPAVAAVVSEEDGWKSRLLRNDKGPKPLLANALLALRHSQEWAGAVSFNEFSMRTEVVEGTPWRPEGYLWADTDDTLLAEWLQLEGIEVPPSTASQAIEAIARERGHHAVRDYLDGLVWDGVPRIDSWLATYLGAESGTKDDGKPTDTARYVSAVGSRWLISAVARVMRPGCQADYALVFEGLQGKGKSSVLRALACRDEWFTDNIGEFGSKDSKIQLLGKWLIEIAEMSQIVAKRAEMETVKAFISERYDNFRPPYGRRAADFPRQCVFAGSTNSDTYLRDETGNRRFWPVLCPLADVAGVIAIRDQLWAEAMHRYRAGEKWWLWEPELIAIAEDEQDRRLDRDVWDGPIWSYLVRSREDFVHSRNPVDAFRVTSEEILSNALKKDIGEWTQNDKARITRILKIRGMKYLREWMYDGDNNKKLDDEGRHMREYRWAFPGRPA